MNIRSVYNIGRIALLCSLAAFTTGCLDNFEQYNRNPNETSDEELDRDNYRVGAKLTQLQNLVIPTEEHLNQFVEILVGDGFSGYAESTVDSWETKFSTFNPSVDWLKAPFVDVITKTYPAYRGVINATEDDVALALAKLLRVAIMHRLTDQYGPIPYTKIIENKKEQLTVAYDSQQEVYTQMFNEIDEALSVLKANEGLSASAFADYDQVYVGNIHKWVKYANSLKLRMALRLAYVDATSARARAQEAISGGVIEVNADNAKFQPTLNRCAMIWNDWQDHVVGADLISFMNGYNDPRRTKMFTTVSVTETVLNPTTGKNETVTRPGFRGMRIGITPTSSKLAKSACSYPLITDKDPFLWINAAEVAFLRAEFALRWGTTSEAGDHYRHAVALSFEEYDTGKADTYLQTITTPGNFIDPLEGNHGFSARSTITPVWSDSDLFETALERIITQKWIAIFPLGNEAWAEYRRTGYPRLMPVPDAGNKSGGTVNSKFGARRIQYPAEEYAENRANVTEAVSSKLDGSRDNAGTRVWWDKKPLN